MAFQKITRQLLLSILGGLIAAGLLAGGPFLVAFWPFGDANEVTRAEIRKTSSSSAIFPTEESFDVIRVHGYKATVSGSGLVRDVEIFAKFSAGAQILRFNVLYSINISGFETKFVDTSQIKFMLAHYLDAVRSVDIYLLTKNTVETREEANNLNPPKVTFEGRDQDDRPVYAVAGRE